MTETRNKLQHTIENFVNCSESHRFQSRRTKQIIKHQKTILPEIIHWKLKYKLSKYQQL